MKGKLIEFLNDDKSTRFLEYKGGDGNSVELFEEIASQHHENIEVHTFDPRGSDGLIAKLNERGFSRRANTFKKNNLYFYPMLLENYTAQSIKDNAAICDVAVCFDEKICENTRSSTRSLILEALAAVADSVIYSVPTKAMVSSVYVTNETVDLLVNATLGQPDHNQRAVIENGEIKRMSIMEAEDIRKEASDSGCKIEESLVDKPSSWLGCLRTWEPANTRGIVLRSASKLDNSEEIRRGR